MKSILVVLVLSLLTACGGDGGDTPTSNIGSGNFVASTISQDLINIDSNNGKTVLHRVFFALSTPQILTQLKPDFSNTAATATGQKTDNCTESGTRTTQWSVTNPQTTNMVMDDYEKIIFNQCENSPGIFLNGSSTITANNSFNASVFQGNTSSCNTVCDVDYTVFQDQRTTLNGQEGAQHGAFAVTESFTAGGDYTTNITTAEYYAITSATLAALISQLSQSSSFDSQNSLYQGSASFSFATTELNGGVDVSASYTSGITDFWLALFSGPTQLQVIVTGAGGSTATLDGTTTTVSISIDADGDGMADGPAETMTWTDFFIP